MFVVIFNYNADSNLQHRAPQWDIIFYSVSLNTAITPIMYLHAPIAAYYAGIKYAVQIHLSQVQTSWQALRQQQFGPWFEWLAYAGAIKGFCDVDLWWCQSSQSLCSCPVLVSFTVCMAFLKSAELPASQ